MRVRINGLLFAILTLFVCNISFAGTDNGSGMPDEEDVEDRWEESYVFPLKEDVRVWDKSFPLPEVLRELSSPGDQIFLGGESDWVVGSGPFPLPLTPSVESYLRHYTTKGKRGMQTRLQRSGLYRDMILDKVHQRGMPEELLYLCMIESAFQPKAKSHAGAKGLWQFIHSTGLRYNLRIDYWVDERYDPEKSTQAALNYLSDLYGMFGDWHLAAASYNTGEALVARRLQSTGCPDYWCLCDKKKLVAETRNYLPLIIASAIIGQDPERYGFLDVEYLPPIKYSKVAVEDAIDLKVVADCAGTTEKHILALNPEILQFCTPPGQRRYQVKVPYGKAKEFKKAYAALSPEQKFAFKRHKVESGQTLQAIAAGYGVSTDSVLAMNQGLSSRLYPGQTITIPVRGDAKFDGKKKPMPAPDNERKKPKPVKWEPRDDVYEKIDQDLGGAPKKKAPVPHGKKDRVYVVEAGDTPWEIARMWGVSVDDILKWNDIDDPKDLRYGTSLVIKNVSSDIKVTPAEKNKLTPIKNSRKVDYTVREGDRCYFIARHYGITSQHIIADNKLDPNCSIRPGQKLTLNVPKSAPQGMPPTSKEILEGTRRSVTPDRDSGGTQPSVPRNPNHGTTRSAGNGKVIYVVKDGDNLWQVARDHDTHMEDIRKMNGLESDGLRPGQELTIKPGPEYKAPKQPAKSAPAPAPPKTEAAAAPEKGVKTFGPSGANSTAPAAPAPKPSTEKKEGWRGAPIKYTVKEGESLWGIARKHDVRVDEIKALNHLESDGVRPGQELTIKPGPGYSASGSSGSSSNKPKGSSGSGSSSAKEEGERGPAITYVVKEGESLWGIARKHDVHVEEIKEWNGLESDGVRVGQELVIKPGPGYKK